MSEPQRGTLAEALKSLKQGVSRRLIGDAEHFWQKRYYDFNIRSDEQFVEKLGYIHLNPVRAGYAIVLRTGSGVASCSTRRAAKGGWRSNVNGWQESVNAPRGNSLPHENCPAQAKTELEWATRQTSLGPRQLSHDTLGLSLIQ